MARLISNSGGRTSGLMTWLEVQKGLGPDDYIVFANTGKEKEETLQFLHNQELHWGIKMYWIEYCRFNQWKQVTFETASRNGEPFETLLMKRRLVPNIMARWCTTELKIRVMKAFMRSMGHGHWENVVGIRADEPRRLAKVKESTSRERWDTVHPLAKAGITKPDVLHWWCKQPFDLELEDHEGNCDLCYLKGKKKKIAIIRKEPHRADWWIGVEQAMGNTFRKGESYAHYQQLAVTDLFQPVADEPEFSCFCGD